MSVLLDRLHSQAENVKSDSEYNYLKLEELALMNFQSENITDENIWKFCVALRLDYQEGYRMYRNLKGIGIL